MSELLSRIAGGPITWGVTGEPEASHQMSHERVLREMAGPCRTGHRDTAGSFEEILEREWGE